MWVAFLKELTNNLRLEQSQGYSFQFVFYDLAGELTE